MRRSDTRILTTHTGSLPRPPELTRLYVRRARGEAVDPAELAAAGKAALRESCAKQIEAGIDVGNNGEQQREAFFLYVPHRMSGFGGALAARGRAPTSTRYPVFKRMACEQQLRAGLRSATSRPPKAIGEVRYLDPAAVEAECADFRAALDARGERLRRAVPDRALARHRRRRDARTSTTTPRTPISPRSAAALQVEYEAIVGARLPAAARLPRPRARAPHLLSGPAARRFPRLRRARRRGDQRGARQHPARAGAPARLLGQLRGPARSATCRSQDILPIIRQAKVGGFVLPFANPRHAHEYRCLKDLPLDDDQILVAGVIDTLTNFVEHPEVVADRHRARRARGRRSAPRAGRHRLRLRHLGRAGPGRRGRGLGQAGLWRRRPDRLAAARNAGVGVRRRSSTRPSPPGRSSPRRPALPWRRRDGRTMPACPPPAPGRSTSPATGRRCGQGCASPSTGASRVRCRR